MAYEALYRRYRPSRFADVAGQAHVVSALRNAVEADRVGHAYLFSGPRGTGKTSSARILAKALNCTDLQGGEPCNRCESCQTFLAGGSYDLHELDAASNNGVDAMRDLIGKVALGSPGRTKVYILDEVHMLTGGAENALLKTLEEPPPHVVFVLCTTEPNKVVPTIRSRTQHLEFALLSDTDLASLVDHVVTDAELDLSESDRAYVIRAGSGSARDTLSALDRVVAAGGAPEGGEHLDALFQALVDRDGTAALVAIDGAVRSGRDPAGIAASLLADLRAVFLATMRADVEHLPESERAKALERAAAMPPARVTRAVEVIGTSAIEMRQAPDPRVDLEVAVVRLTRADLDVTPEALLERIEALEQGGAHTADALQTRHDESPDLAGDPTASATAVPEVDAGVAPSARQVPEADAASLAGAGLRGSEAPSVDAVPAAPDEPETAASASAPASVSTSEPASGVAKHGPEIARAALAQQQGSRRDSQAVAAARPDLSTAPRLSKTLADVRAERRAVAQPADAAADLAAPAPTMPADPKPIDTPVDEVAERRAARAGSATTAGSTVSTNPEESPPGTASPDVPAAAEPTPPAPPEPGASTPAASGDVDRPTLDEFEQAWAEGLLDSLSGRARSRFSAGRFLLDDSGQVAFGLPNPVHRDRCAEVRDEVDRALASHFGRPVPVDLIVDTAEPEPDLFATAPWDQGQSGAQSADELDEEVVDLDGLVDAADQAPTGVDRVLAVFEGSVVVDEDPSSTGGDGR